MKPHKTREPDRDELMVMITFHPLLNHTTIDIRKTEIFIFPTNLLKVSGLGEKLTVSDLTPPEQPNTCTIAIFNR